MRYKELLAVLLFCALARGNVVKPNRLPYSKCKFTERDVQKITVDDATLAKASEIAEKIDNATQKLVEVFTDLEPITDESSKFVSAHAQPIDIRENVESTRKSEILLHVLDEIFKVKRGISPHYLGSAIPQCKSSEERIKNDSVEKHCNFPDAYKYYQIQGACLNPSKPGAGLAGREMTRLGEPYLDLDDQDRKCALPSSRKVSLALGHILKERKETKRTKIVPNLLALYWFQVVVHEIDFGQVIGPVMGANSTASCGANGRDLPEVLRNPYTKGIEVACDDPFYKKHGVRCLNFQRNHRLNEKCTLKRANFLNAATPTLDLSTVYQRYDPVSGTFVSDMAPDGKLLKGPNGELVVPFDNNNQHSLIVGVALMLGKMHDLLVDELKRLQPDLAPLQAFVTAQRINIAFYQHIWYYHLLALFIGNQNALTYSLADTFDETTEPQILQEWATSAGRFCHVLVTDKANLACCETFQPRESFLTRDTFGDKLNLGHTKYNPLGCGMISQPWRTKGLSPELQNNMFFDEELKYGGDLFAIDQERQRDGSIEPYINYLRRLFGVCVKKWSDLEKFLSKDAIKKLKKLYKKVEDVELYVAGSAELPDEKNGSTLGPTFRRLTEIQFENLKKGDPKFYTHALTPVQLGQIAKMDLNKFTCIVLALQKNLKDARFAFTHKLNEVVDCECKTLADCFDLSSFLGGDGVQGGSTQAPVTSSEAPVSSSEAPVSSSEAPVSSSEAPVSSSEAPISSSEAPVSSSEAPISSSEAPVSSSEAPISSSEAPPSSSQAPPSGYPNQGW